MKKDLISIIVPVYNVVSYLPRCLDSLVNQTYKDIEIILVNDGSTDNSLDICKEYAVKDKRITIIDKENGGVSSARNAGIHAARGNWIGFVDSDDYIDSETYEIAIKTALENNASLVQWNLVRFSDKAVYPVDSDINEGFFDLTENKVLPWICNLVYTKLFRKDFLEQTGINFIEGVNLGEDLFFNYRVLNKLGKFYYINKAFYHYFIRPSSIMNTMNESLIDRAVEELIKMEADLKGSKNQTLLNSLFARKIEVKQNYIDALSIPNPRKFRQAFKELNSYFLNKGKTYIAAILGLDCLVKYVKGRKKNIRKN